MPAPFRRFDVAQFAELVRAFPFKREITSFHVHHTWIPRRSDFAGVKSIEAMDRHHRLVRKFSDIAQHITLDPDGFIWSGRSWNSPPASALGFNGNSKAGPFMMEMIGDFDTGQEPFDGVQADNAYRVVAIILKHFRLRPDAIRFHNEMSAKTCPGTSIDKKAFVQNVAQAMKALPAEPEASESDRELLAEALTGLLEPLARTVAPRAADLDTELPENEETYTDYAARIEAEFDETLPGARAAGSLDPAQLADLVPHVVNLRRGKFSEDDLFVSNTGTVDAIFAGLDAQLRNASPQKPVKLLFLAHGGLVSQRSALAKAHRDLWFWKNNGIYPIFFVWQTSLGTAFRDAIARSREGARDIDFFTIPDRIVEGFVRHFGGIEAWDSMKLSAAEGSATGGGGLYVATKLQALAAAHGANLQLHAFGHSAGAIFHSHFLRAANVPFQSLHLLAPAIRIDEYTRLLDPLLDPAQLGIVRNPVIYTMRDKLERDDTCTPAYHKSLLYLISRGLEQERDTPILGMERFLTKDPVAAARFGIANGPGTVGRVFFSPSAQTKASAHGCFDDDVATMNSIVTAIRGSAPAPPYENTGAGKCTRNSVFAEPRELPEELARELARALSQPPPPPLPPGSALAATGRAFPTSRATGRRRALCVGINAYPSDPLYGCVADAEAWARALVALGFETPTMLLDSVATRQAILDTLTRLLESSSAGDVVVFQYSGHGTQLRDLDGDEVSDHDQAICPVNFRDGELLIDDDIAGILARTPAGVAVTCFLDNCYSGTGTRFAIGRADSSPAAGDRPRFVVADERLEEKHAIFRRSMTARGGRPAGSRGLDTMREVVFSACRPDELAWESNGQGDFTRNALALLSGSSPLTNAQFQDSLTRGFTPGGRQHPTLDCAPSAESAPLFTFDSAAAPLAMVPPRAGAPAPHAPPGTANWLRELASSIDR